MISSRVLRKLRAGDVVRTAAITRVTQPWLVEVIGKLGFDLIWLDLEHRPFSDDIIDPISLACRLTGMDLMVRTVKNGYWSPMRALECGANGIMAPHCLCAADARQWAAWSRFPPLGKRGFDGAGADADFGLVTGLDHIKHANQQIFVAVQIEDAEAVEAVDEIAAVDGVDVLFVGPADLSLSYGVPLQSDHPVMRGAMAKVAAAAERAGKWWGTITPNAAIAQEMVDRGARFLTCGNDHDALMRGFQQSCREFSTVVVRG